jgi:hypothetical protein
MLKDDPKQHKLLFSPIVFEKLIPEDHFYRKLRVINMKGTGKVTIYVPMGQYPPQIIGDGDYTLV